MRLKKIVDEDFTDYKDPCMFLCTISCSGKCCREAGLPLSVCQNDDWRGNWWRDYPSIELIKHYLKNPITGAICFGGLEPFEQFDEMFDVIETLRRVYDCDDTVVIYTGYNQGEITEQIEKLQHFSNIVIKFGRFIPGQEKHYDDILGVYLASDNQYAKKIS